MLTKRGGGLV